MGCGWRATGAAAFAPQAGPATGPASRLARMAATSNNESRGRRQAEPRPTRPRPRGASADGAPRTLASNRRAHHDYHILESVEAGIQRQGAAAKTGPTDR